MHLFAKIPLKNRILISLVSTSTVIALAFNLIAPFSPKEYPLKDVLYVSNWDITKIYGPGTEEQMQIVKAFEAIGITNYNSTVLYRMGGKNSFNGAEGLILAPFNPNKPESARVLIAKE